MEYYAVYESPVGRILLRSDGESLTGLELREDAAQCGENREDLPIFRRAKGWLDGYFRGENPSADLPVKLSGTPFQQAVWEILREIPYGETRTYGALAKEIAVRRGMKAMSAQAVGGAVGKNPVSVLIPCHRVVGARGQLTGFRWGVRKKAWLLAHEQGRNC